MSHELHYTSAPCGLRPGSRGFGTVAATAGLSDSIADRLEALSAYRAVYPPGDPSEPLNPIAYVHARLTVGGTVHDVLSRIGPAGLDYSGRPNKYAHHIILDPGELPDAGPAWLLAQPGFLRDGWEGEPRILTAGVGVPRGDRPPGVARAWEEQTGDAGWAGALAGSFLDDPRRPVFLVFRPGIELLPLFVEAIALLPVARRWDVEFSTYLTSLPPGVTCNWRGVLDGSPELKAARRLPNAMILDLVRPPGQAPGGRLVHLARTGQMPEAEEPVAPMNGLAPTRAITAGPPPKLRPSAQDAGFDGLPDLAAQLASESSLLGGEAIRRPRRRRWIDWLAIAATVLAIGAAVVAISPDLRRRIGLEKPVSSIVDNAPRPAPPARPQIRPAAPIEIVTPPTPSVPEDLAPPTAVVATPTPRVPAAPILLAFAPPEVPRSTLGTPVRQDRTIPLLGETTDRIEIRNGPGFAIAPVAGVAHAFEVATRTGSGLGGGVAIARLTRDDPRGWRFEWTRTARARSSPVEGLKDALLEFEGRDGRSIRVLLRGIPIEQPDPLEVWKDQRILNDRLDARTKSVNWAGDPDPIEGSRWKPRILHWKLSIAQVAAPKGRTPIEQWIEPAPVDGDPAAADGPPMEADLIPGEVVAKIAINPDRPGRIDVRIDPDADRIPIGREDRAAQWHDFEARTPADHDGKRQDPLAFRQKQLQRMLGARKPNNDAIKTLREEIAALDRIAGIRRTETLLTGRSRALLSAVIGLDIDGVGILEIVRTGEFARSR